MRIVITNVDPAAVAESIPWPWYAGAIAVLVGGLVWGFKLVLSAAFRPLSQAQSGEWIPRATVDLMIKAKDEEIARKEADFASFRAQVAEDVKTIRAEYVADMAAMRADAAAELVLVRERHDRYMEAMDANHARETEGTRRDSADWRTAYHLAAEVGKVQAAQLDELVEGNRLILGLIQALPKVDSDSPEVNNRAGRGTPG